MNQARNMAIYLHENTPYDNAFHQNITQILAEKRCAKSENIDRLIPVKMISVIPWENACIRYMLFSTHTKPSDIKKIKIRRSFLEKRNSFAVNPTLERCFVDSSIEAAKTYHTIHPYRGRYS